MARILQHLPDETGNCPICGTSAMMIGKGYTCIWRDAPDARTRGMAPEPARRIPACEDADAISRGLTDLRKEREDARNTEQQC